MITYTSAVPFDLVAPMSDAEQPETDAERIAALEVHVKQQQDDIRQLRILYLDVADALKKIVSYGEAIEAYEATVKEGMDLLERKDNNRTAQYDAFRAELEEQLEAHQKRLDDHKASVRASHVELEGRLIRHEESVNEAVAGLERWAISTFNTFREDARRSISQWLDIFERAQQQDPKLKLKAFAETNGLKYNTLRNAQTRRRKKKV